MPEGTVPGGKYVAGDVVLYDRVQEQKVVAEPDKLSNFNPKRFEPIAVIAIPSSHDVYGTGEAGAVSLMYMNCESPDSGSIYSQKIYWGAKSDTALQNYLGCNVGYNSSQNNEIECFTNGLTGYLPSDLFSAEQCLTDPLSFYDYDDINAYHIPSPYKQDESRNPSYYTTETSIENMLSDFSGKESMNILLEYSRYFDSWKTANSISNKNNDTKYFPAVFCCWRFCPNGTNQGDWYLPAIGELCYIIVRFKLIN